MERGKLLALKRHEKETEWGTFKWIIVRFEIVSEFFEVGHCIQNPHPTLKMKFIFPCWANKDLEWVEEGWDEDDEPSLVEMGTTKFPSENGISYQKVIACAKHHLRNANLLVGA